jgi:hypothetical protein
MREFLTVLPLAVFLFAPAASQPRDGFSGIRCDSDIAKTLIGRTMHNEKVAPIENRHKDLGLKNLGGDEISDKFFSETWLICGHEYMLLVDRHNIVRDVLSVPEHSKKSPEFIGECKNNGARIPGTIIAILQNEEGKDTLSAKAAWKLDEKTAKFVKLPTAGLRCPRDGIITADGGK